MEIIGETSVTIVATIFNNNVRHTLVCGVTLGLATISDRLNKEKSMEHQRSACEV